MSGRIPNPCNNRLSPVYPLVDWLQVTDAADDIGLRFTFRPGGFTACEVCYVPIRAWGEEVPGLAYCLARYTPCVYCPAYGQCDKAASKETQYVGGIVLWSHPDRAPKVWRLKGVELVIGDTWLQLPDGLGVPEGDTWEVLVDFVRAVYWPILGGQVDVNTALEPIGLEPDTIEQSILCPSDIEGLRVRAERVAVTDVAARLIDVLALEDFGLEDFGLEDFGE